MKIKYITICLSAILLTQCIDIASFKPPPRYFIWNSPKNSLKSISDEDFYNWVVWRNKEMRSCGMDPFWGESLYAKHNLCLEKKGWYLDGGPYCENELAWDDPVCIEWRKKHSKPDAKPWDRKKESSWKWR